MASTAIFVGGLSILVSIGCRRNGGAIATALSLMFAWLILPLLIWAFLPRTMPRLAPWVHPVNRWLLASSPAGVFSLAAFGIITGGGGRIDEALLWMIGLQLAAGTLLIGLAIGRLRPVARKLEDGEGGDPARRRARHRWRITARPACGESPVLWKEMHTAKPNGLADLLGILAVVVIFGWIGYGTYYFGKPALIEWLRYGFARSAPDTSRWEFNNYLRGITSLTELVCLLIVAGAAAEGVAAERARATWDGLLATPLEAREILCAKMLGAVWKARWGIVLTLALWSAGLMAGALHPLGVAAALSLLIASTWFVAALGMLRSLVSRDVAHATARVLTPLILLTCTFVLCYWPSRMASVIMGAGSVPFVNCLCLMSYRDFGEAIGQRRYGYLTMMGIFTNEAADRVLATYVIATAGYAAAAVWCTLAAIRRFDRIAGRPARPRASSVADSMSRTQLATGRLQ
jgi:hypothetical protein